MANDLTDIRTPARSVVDGEEIRTIIVSDGFRGSPGPAGPEGPQGPQGATLNVRGAWTPGADYCPLDAVSARGTASQGIQSMYIQRSNVPCSASTVEPHLDPGRWQEIGATDLQNVTGAIWEIQQPGHNLNAVGMPVVFNPATLSWTPGGSRKTIASAIVAVVREVIDDTRVILQSSGEVPNIDPSVITPPGGDWEAGRVYYASGIDGALTLDPPDDPTTFRRQPVLVATRNHTSTTDPAAPGSVTGVLLPWTPDAPPAPVALMSGRPVTQRYYFRGEDMQAPNPPNWIRGTDFYGNLMDFPVTADIEVFQNGQNVLEYDAGFTTSGYTIVSEGWVFLYGDAVAEPGDRYEIWVFADPDTSGLLVPSVAEKLDNIESLFDGTRTSFPLTVLNNTPVAQPDAVALQVYLDNHPQEPLVDFITEDDPGDPGVGSLLTFTYAPQPGDRFWAILGRPASP
jgi:hypothetical protein